MQTFTRIRPIIEVPATLVCDRCKKAYDARGSHPSDRQHGASVDVYETQEFLRWKTTGGYASTFGDGARVELDLCQACVQAVLGPWLRITPEG